jgi:hypothetical protein
MQPTPLPPPPSLAEIRAGFRLLGLPDEDQLTPTPSLPQNGGPDGADQVIIVRSNSSAPIRLPDGTYA